MKCENYGIRMAMPISLVNEYLEEAIESTKTIANRCNARLDVKTLKEPQFDVPSGYKGNKEYILHLLKKGMAAKKVRNNLICRKRCITVCG